MEADKLKELIFKRTGLEPENLLCPREYSNMTPCVARDGDMAMPSKDDRVCVGCGANVMELLEAEEKKHKNINN